MTRSRLSAGVALVAAGLLGVLPAVVTPAPAAALAAGTPLSDARAQAAALRSLVDRLTVRAEMATERYDGLEADLAGSVTQRLLAERQLAAIRLASTRAGAAVSARVRALYMAGGQLGLWATVVSGTDLTDVAARYEDVQAIVTAGQLAARQVAGTARDAGRIAARLRAVAARQTRLEVAAAAAASQVQGLLARERAALAGADARVRGLVAAQQRAAALAAAQAAAAELAAATNGSVSGGLVSGAFIDPRLTGSATPPDRIAAAAITAARSRIGDAYVWGASGPSEFDCSGLVQWSYAQAGLALPRTAAEQWSTGPHPGLADLAPGDLLFWATDTAQPATIHHVGIYLGGGLMLDAPHTGTVVQIQPVYLDGYIGATRPTSGQ
jgi:cell wall-associated NlpC family hydrolase